MKNNNGFTLVELLAVIVILSILITLAYTGVSKYLKETRNTTYKDFEKSITVGAENYLIEHSIYIPKEGETVKIDVSKLIDEGYVDELIDPMDSSKTCSDESYVIITRKNNVSYNMDISYEACLKCINYESSACSNGG